MKRSSLYSDWGFISNPLDGQALDPDRRGKELFVGRDLPRATLTRLINTPPKMTIVESPIGTGKTSFVNRVIFDYNQKYAGNRYFVTCRRFPQLSTNKDADSFEAEAYRNIAESIARAYQEQPWIARLFGSLSIDARLERLLLSPTSRRRRLGMAFAPVSVSETSEQRNDQPYLDRYIRRLVDDWTTKAASRPEFGGVICMLDNLDIVESPKAITDALSRYRDELFVRDGLRWVLCGSSGLHAIAGESRKLASSINPKIALDPLSDDEVIEVVKRRWNYYQDTNQDFRYFPIDPSQFAQLYRSSGRSLAATMSKADEYCKWLAQSGEKPVSTAEKEGKMDEWFGGERRRVADLAGGLDERRLIILKTLYDRGGDCLISDLPSAVYELDTIPLVKTVAESMRETGLVHIHRDSRGDVRALGLSFDGYLCVDMVRARDN